MTSALLIAIFGALAALVANEAVGTRKDRKKRRSYDWATLRAIRQELSATQVTVARNLVDLWDREQAEFRHRHTLRWEATTDPLLPLSSYLDHLIRRDGSADFLGNSRVLELLSGIVALIAQADLLDKQRMRYLGAQYRARPFHIDTDEVAETVEKWETKLLEVHQYLLARILQALCVVALFERERRQTPASRFRIVGFYEPSYHERRALDELIAQTDAFELHPWMRTTPPVDLTGLAEFGLAEKCDDQWLATARGRIVSGRGSKYWFRPSIEKDPPEQRVDWENFDPWDYVEPDLTPPIET